MRKLTLTEVEDILVGCTVLGTGGGGNLQMGLNLLRKDYEEGKFVTLASLDELPKEGYIATPYGCGAPRKEDEDLDEKYNDLPLLNYPASILAFQRLEEYLGKKFVAVSSTELGGENTAEALHVACELKLPLADGDPAGRSVPELQHSTYFVYDKKIDPLSVATNFGESIIIENVVNDFRAEDIVRAITVASGNEAGVADHPMSIEDYKNSVITGAISYALNIGETLREAKESNKDVAKAIVDKVGGKVLFKGILVDTDWETKDGFNIGKMYLDGIEDYEDEKYMVYFQNENIYSMLNGEVDVSVPDLICMLDKDGNPFTTPNFKDNMEVTFFALAAPDIWKTSEGLKVFGPESFGLDFPYRGI